MLLIEMRNGEAATPLVSLLISGTQASRTASEVLGTRGVIRSFETT